MRSFPLASSTSWPCYMCIHVALESSWARRPHRVVGCGAKGAVRWGRKPTAKPKVSVRKDEAGCECERERGTEAQMLYRYVAYS